MNLKELLRRIFKGKKQDVRPVRRGYYSGVNFGDKSEGVIYDNAEILIFKNNQFVIESMVDLSKTEHISDDKTLFNTINKDTLLLIKASEGDKIDVDINTIIYDSVSQVIKSDIYISAKNVEITSSGDVIVDNAKTKTIVEYR